MQDGGYRKLDIYKESHELAVKVHKMTMKLPMHELFEEGSQVRKASKRVSASIVEGYALRRYKALYLSYLYRAHGSCDETQEHLKYLQETGSAQETTIAPLLGSYEDLSRKIYRFIAGVEREHLPPKPPEPEPIEPDDPEDAHD